MLRTYIYQENENNWFEENKNLLLHDLAAFLDEDKKKLYIWNGPDSNKKRLERGYESMVELLSNYPDDSIQLTLLMDDIPKNIKVKLEEMLKNAKLELKTDKIHFTKLFTIRLYLIFSVLSIMLPLLSMVNLSNFILSPVSGNSLSIPITGYHNWLTISNIIMFITLTCYIITILIGIYERDEQVIIVSLVGIITCIGIILYLSQGIFLFKFQAQTEESYLILTQDLLIFFGLNIFALLVIEIPSFVKFCYFFYTYIDYIFIR
ncbi:MAG: hypothetical protein ACFFBP_07160 [Promethearchaeota archaeon]